MSATPLVRALPFVYTSVLGPDGVGYRVVARAPGVRRDEESELELSVASQLGTWTADRQHFSRYPEAYLAFPFRTGRLCVARVTDAGSDASDRPRPGRIRVVAHVLDAGDYGALEADPRAFERSFAALDRDDVESELAPVGVAAPRAAAEDDVRALLALPPGTAAALLAALAGPDRVVVVSPDLSPAPLLGALRLLDRERRAAVSYASASFALSGLHRRLRVVVVPPRVVELEGAPGGAQVVDLTEGGASAAEPAALEAAPAYVRAVARVLSERDEVALAQLARDVDRLGLAGRGEAEVEGYLAYAPTRARLARGAGAGAGAAGARHAAGRFEDARVALAGVLAFAPEDERAALAGAVWGAALRASVAGAAGAAGDAAAQVLLREGAALRAALPPGAPPDVLDAVRAATADAIGALAASGRWAPALALLRAAVPHGGPWPDVRDATAAATAAAAAAAAATATALAGPFVERFAAWCAAQVKDGAAPAVLSVARAAVELLACEPACADGRDARPAWTRAVLAAVGVACEHAWTQVTARPGVQDVLRALASRAARGAPALSRQDQDELVGRLERYGLEYSAADLLLSGADGVPGAAEHALRLVGACSRVSLGEDAQRRLVGLAFPRGRGGAARLGEWLRGHTRPGPQGPADRRHASLAQAADVLGAHGDGEVVAGALLEHDDPATAREVLKHLVATDARFACTVAGAMARTQAARAAPERLFERLPEAELAGLSLSRADRAALRDAVDLVREADASLARERERERRDAERRADDREHAARAPFVERILRVNEAAALRIEATRQAIADEIARIEGDAAARRARVESEQRRALAPVEAERARALAEVEARFAARADEVRARRERWEALLDRGRPPGGDGVAGLVTRLAGVARGWGVVHAPLPGEGSESTPASVLAPAPGLAVGRPGGSPGGGGGSWSTSPWLALAGAVAFLACAASPIFTGPLSTRDPTPYLRPDRDVEPDPVPRAETVPEDASPRRDVRRRERPDARPR